MDWLFWLAAAYLFVAVLVFIGLCRRLEPLDLAALLSLAAAALVWPLTLAGGR